MSAALLGAATALLLLASVYVCARRGRHGGLAGGDSTGVAPAGAREPGSGRPLSRADVARHNKAEDLWLVIHGRVYDFTEVRLEMRRRLLFCFQVCADGPARLHLAR
jgi:Cytochrome b5-like Heme/Steroid binding domain